METRCSTARAPPTQNPDGRRRRRFPCLSQRARPLFHKSASFHRPASPLPTRAKCIVVSIFLQTKPHCNNPEKVTLPAHAFRPAQPGSLSVGALFPGCRRLKRPGHLNPYPSAERSLQIVIPVAVNPMRNSLQETQSLYNDRGAIRDRAISRGPPRTPRPTGTGGTSAAAT